MAKPIEITLENAWEKRVTLSRRIKGRFPCHFWLSRFEYSLKTNNEDLFMAIILHNFRWLVNNKIMGVKHLLAARGFETTSKATEVFRQPFKKLIAGRRHLLKLTRVILKEPVDGSSHWMMNQQGELVKKTF